MTNTQLFVMTLGFIFTIWLLVDIRALLRQLVAKR
jgi:hypothetical protein